MNPQIRPQTRIRIDASGAVALTEQNCRRQPSQSSFHREQWKRKDVFANSSFICIEFL